MAKTDISVTSRAVFADKAYKSRTIVLSDGRSFAVERGRIEADDPALIAYLEQHPDFERVAGE